MRTHPKAWTYGITGVTLLAALALFFAPHFRDPSVAAPRTVTKPVALTTAPDVQPARIVPADVLGNGTRWAPLTGDGSN